MFGVRGGGVFVEGRAGRESGPHIFEGGAEKCGRNRAFQRSDLDAKRWSPKLEPKLEPCVAETGQIDGRTPQLDFGIIVATPFVDHTRLTYRGDMPKTSVHTRENKDASGDDDDIGAGLPDRPRARAAVYREVR